MQMLRTTDPKFSVTGLKPDVKLDAKGVVDTLVAHPEVMQRPVVVRGERAVIARPSEKVLELLEE